MPAAWVSSNDTADASGGTDLTLSITYSAGDFGAFLVTYASGTSVTENMTDGTNTYTKINSYNDGTNNQSWAIFYCANAVVGTYTVRFNLATSQTSRGLAYRTYSGVTGTPIAAFTNNNNPGSGANAVTSGNLTPGSQPGLLIGFCMDDSGGESSISIGTGFTTRGAFTNWDSAIGILTQSEDKRITSLSAVAATFTAGTGTGRFGTFAIYIPEGTNPTITQTTYRFRNDNGSETGATWPTNENSAVVSALDTNIRLRVQLDTLADVGSIVYQLEYKLFSDPNYSPLLVSAPSVPTYQAAGTAVSGTGDVSPAWPTHQIGDIGILCVESCGGEAAVLGVDGGFQAVTNSPQSTGTTTNGTRTTMFWCRASTSFMPAPTVTDPGNHAYAQIFTIRGGIPNGVPFNITGGGVKAAASTTVSITGVTTTVNNCLIFACVCRDVTGAGGFFSAESNANLTSLTEQVDAGTTSGNGGGFAVITGILATAGASGTTTATVTSSINSFLTVAIMPPSTQLMIASSTNITAGGQATTTQITPPGSKTASNFTTGRMWGDENGIDSIHIASGNYTELEWCLQAISANGSVNGALYNLRITSAGASLNTYSNSPILVVGTSLGGSGITGVVWPSSPVDTFTDATHTLGNQSQFDASGNALTSFANGCAFYWASAPSAMPMTAIWRTLRRKVVGYTNSFLYTGDNFGGLSIGDHSIQACPYPDNHFTLPIVHHYEVSTAGQDETNSSAALVPYGVWKTQACIISVSGAGYQVQHYYDLGSGLSDITFDSGGVTWSASSPHIVIGDSPWTDFTVESSNTIYRGLQIYTAKLSTTDLLTEAANATSNAAQSAAGIASLWYINQNPTPTDVTDKSGNGHNPSWMTATRPTLYSTVSSSTTSVSSARIVVPISRRIKFIGKTIIHKYQLKP